MSRTNYYQDLKADYSAPVLIAPALADKLLSEAVGYTSQVEESLPDVSESYTLDVIEEENKAWWPTHCEALRQGNVAILTDEYRDDVVYLTQQGPFYGKGNGTEASWWKLLSQPDVIMVWPIVMFSGEVVYFEWMCIDKVTHEMTAKGNVTWLRRGHKGGCYLKTEQLTFYRDVTAEFFVS
ncbi:hypothetical protein MNBD_GAMMA14-270 [hydrothermal vent metagenome]|uniref:Uncharacterized protein n=1 Tax=hydrothermal vent metagenome TaxID=652676 RepID=A0A3B0ZCA9_9ZZZZ